ncbi:MAG: PIN domain-containing protein [Gammaproteobacteria bacterium]|uniref:PIN domain-containing protein n=1 Tax=Rhodoferax sp. TaxID=50421 RepID=UPI0017C681E3|nr:PIN domain-containing protein [Rhodoferax sp.]MBU3898714.1 PIN domain-containing protein [Gammaproteobacteria bacterium]MBA3056451.1 type II toxin-antitoxin system VapC family toxin [Rhodoferax sp.]MBU3997218.1 PIN domain-containing protein [Gammaproteobacteria bacterium]MBU4080815.1 PIN domain-containing protein [Gammaproteobacteria bacterium]MBU4112460.1 PIN domain-containing protein [Gammaproteobacteria bacterium]
MRVTLDTNICSYILRSHPANMIERFAALERSQVWLSSIVAAELRFGAAKLASVRFSAAVESWLAGFDVRPWPVEASHHYAQMRCALERVGKPVGAMDMLIAAHALAEDSAIITNNAREFYRIPGLAVQEWAIE